MQAVTDSGWMFGGRTRTRTADLLLFTLRFQDSSPIESCCIRIVYETGILPSVAYASRPSLTASSHPPGVAPFWEGAGGAVFLSAFGLQLE